MVALLAPLVAAANITGESLQRMMMMMMMMQASWLSLK